MVPTIILSMKDIEALIKERYGVKEIAWKIVKKNIEISFEQELELKSSVSRSGERERLKKEYTKSDEVMTTGERTIKGRF